MGCGDKRWHPGSAPQGHSLNLPRARCWVVLGASCWGWSSSGWASLSVTGARRVRNSGEMGKTLTETLFSGRLLSLDVALFPDPDIKEVKVVARRNKQPRETLKSFYWLKGSPATKQAGGIHSRASLKFIVSQNPFQKLPLLRGSEHWLPFLPVKVSFIWGILTLGS